MDDSKSGGTEATAGCSDPSSWEWGKEAGPRGDGSANQEEWERYGRHVVKCPYHCLLDEQGTEGLRQLLEWATPAEVARATGISEDASLEDLKRRMKEMVARHPELYRRLHAAQTDEERALIAAELEDAEAEDEMAEGANHDSQKD